MKQIIIFITIIYFFVFPCIGQNFSSDTIRHSGVVLLRSDDNSSISARDILPWLIALLLGLATLYLTNRQIKLSRYSIDKQVNTSKEIAQLELNKSVKSANRQQWINTLRDCVSEYLALLETYKVDYENAKKLNEVMHFKKINTSAFEIKKLSVKIELMLNPEEEKSKRFLKIFFDISTFVLDESSDLHSNQYQQDYVALKLQLVSITKSILKEEWERVKKGE